MKFTYSPDYDKQIELIISYLMTIPFVELRKRFPDFELQVEVCRNYRKLGELQMLEADMALTKFFRLIFNPDKEHYLFFLFRHDTAHNRLRNEVLTNLLDFYNK